MNRENNNELLGKFTVGEREQTIYEYAKRFHAESEAYDRTVCTGPIVRGEIMPATSNERRLCESNAFKLRDRIIKEAVENGFASEEVLRAIKKWRE